MMDLSPMMPRFRARFALTEGKTTMFRHGPSCLDGPVSRAIRGWSGKDISANSSLEPSEIRADLVERIRREIAEGRYETAEKWEAALDLLFLRLRDA